MKTVLSIIFSLFMLNSFSQTENTWKHSNGNFKISDEKLNELVTEEVEDYFKNHPDLMDDIVSKVFAKSVDEIDINIIMKFISQKPELSKIIDELALKVAKEVYSTEINEITSVQNIFDAAADSLKPTLTKDEYNALKKMPTNIETALEKTITPTNTSYLKLQLDSFDELLSKLQPASEEVTKMRKSIKLKLKQIAEQEARVQEEVNRIKSKQEEEHD